MNKTMKITFTVAGLLVAGAVVEGARAQTSIPDFTNAVCEEKREEFLNAYMRMTGNEADGSLPTGPARGARALGTPVVAEHVRRLQAFYNGLTGDERIALQYEALINRESVSEANRAAFRDQYGSALRSAHRDIRRFQSQFSATSHCHNRLLYHPSVVQESGDGAGDVRTLFNEDGSFGCSGVEYPPSRLSRARLLVNRTTGEQWLAVCSLITEVRLTGFIDLEGSEVGDSSRVCSSINLGNGVIRGATYDASIRSPLALQQNDRSADSRLVAAWATHSGAEYVSTRFSADPALSSICQGMINPPAEAVEEGSEPAEEIVTDCSSVIPMFVDGVRVNPCDESTSAAE